MGSKTGLRTTDSHVSNAPTTSKEGVPVPVATHFFNQRYLYAFATQAEVRHHLRTQVIEEDTSRLPQILKGWTSLQARVVALLQSEQGLADTIKTSSVPGDYDSMLKEIAEDELFKRTFGAYPVKFALVEADMLVAPQRTVNLDYVNKLAQNYPKEPTLPELLEICLSPKRTMDPIQHLEVAPNTHVFSSPNSDIRFLGAFVKNLTTDDLDYAVMGGLPAAAVIAFVGYGGAPVNVFRVGDRIILNNGFHRVYALRSIGVTTIPVVVQQIENADLEAPPVIAGLPKEYLLKAPRPVLLKDFFQPDFALTLKARERIKLVTVGIGLSQHDVPS